MMKSISPASLNANLKTDAVAVRSSRPNLKLKIALLRIKEREKLRIGKKNVYVIALAMIDLEHHAAAERPMINNGSIRINLSNQCARDLE